MGKRIIDAKTAFKQSIKNAGRIAAGMEEELRDLIALAIGQGKISIDFKIPELAPPEAGMFLENLGYTVVRKTHVGGEDRLIISWQNPKKVRA